MPWVGDHFDPKFSWYWNREDLHTGISYFSMDTWGNLTPLGWLEQSREVIDDDCRTSCIDWYGSLRPIFLDRRVLALMDYELVEADLASGFIEEVQRVNALNP